MDSNTGDNHKGILDSDLDFYYAKTELILTSSYSMYSISCCIDEVLMASSNSFGFHWIMFRRNSFAKFLVAFWSPRVVPMLLPLYRIIFFFMLKEPCHETFDLRFFHQTNPSGFQTHGLKPFCIRLRIHGDIRL
jgi:hypothetical protein